MTNHNPTSWVILLVDFYFLRRFCMRVNKVERIALMGGLIGALLTNPRGALDKALSRANVAGWYCRQILPHSTSNLFMLVLSAICLCFTLGLWTFGAGYLLLLEKESE